MFLTQFLYSQLFVTPRYPTQSFAGKTVIVTGSNAGLGLEAARHIGRLGCYKLILAVRTISKGQAAKESITASTKRTDDFIEVWQLDMSSNASIKAFANRVESLSRLDAVIANAGVMTTKFELVEGIESVIQVNVIGTLLLAILLRPKLHETSQAHGVETRLAIVSSEAHHLTNLPEADEKDLYAALNDNTRQYDGQARYNVSKALEILFVREMISKTESNPIVTLVNPGFCVSEFISNVEMSVITRAVIKAFQTILARTTEVGSRTLVAGITTDKGSHGQYMADGINQDPASWVTNARGQVVQKKVFEETLTVLAKVHPGVKNLL